jgi:hypothetical protein
MTFTIEQQMAAQTVLNHIELNPEAHKQIAWASATHACATAGCLAGNTVILLDGWKLQELDRYGVSEMNETGYAVRFFERDENNAGLDVEHRAAEILGLDENEARELFFLAKEETAREALRYIANGKDIDWDKLAKDYDTSKIGD